MKKTRTSLAFGLLLLGTLHVDAGEAPAGARRPVPGLSYRFEKVAEGVYCAIASGVPYYVANSVVILAGEQVALVDSGAGPNEAWALRDALRTLTEHPVRYVIDTHFHFDHALGEPAFPEAVVIAHEETRRNLGPDLLKGGTIARTIAGLPAQTEKLRQDAAREPDASKRGELLQQAAALTAYGEELAGLELAGPQVTFRDDLTLWLGGRELRLLHLGRGHTAGDIVVYLPRERLLCAGDLFNGYIGYMGDAYVDEWAATLGRLATLDFETVVAGHGVPFRGKDAIAPVQACLRDLWDQAAAHRRAGLTADDAARQIDLRTHAARFPRLAQVGYDPLAIRRIYEVIAERAANPPPTR